jgi:putative membrane protein
MRGRHLAGTFKEQTMIRLAAFAAALALALPGAAQAQAPSDPQIAHIAYTAGQIDIDAGKQALAKSQNKDVRSFAEVMVRDHTAVNDKALALVKKLNVTPADNPTSKSLADAAKKARDDQAKLQGVAFDRAYLQHEVAYHKTVNAALKDTLIPNAKNAELKALLETGLKLFQEHQTHAERTLQALK